MDAGRDLKKVVPPYVPYRTLRNFVDGFRQGIPQRIDPSPSLMGSMSGTIRRQLMYAVRYLQLIDEHGIPQENLGRWVRAEGQERQQILRSILQAAYPFLLGDRVNGFDLATATSKQLTEKFQQFDIHGDTVRRAEAFFLHAASDASLTISSYIKKPSQQQGERRRPGRPRNGRKSNRRNDMEEPLTAHSIAGSQILPQETAPQRLTSRDAIVQTFVTKMPDFNPEWGAEVQQSWFEMVKRLTTIAGAADEEQKGER